MSAGNTALTMVLDKIVENVAAVSGMASARVYQGKKRFTDAQNFENLVKALTEQTQGYFGVWLGSFGGDDQYRPGFVTLNALLFINIDKDTSSDCNTMYDFIYSISGAIMADSYTAFAAKPRSIEVKESEENFGDNISAWELTLGFDLPFPTCG